MMVTEHIQQSIPVFAIRIKTKKMKKIVVLSGAGISAESGIKTFRDAGGLWEEHNIDDVATPDGFRRNPMLVLDFYNQRRKQLVNCQPNFAHTSLANLETKFNVQIITQNVDNLHERAGSSNILHLHGELMKVRSTGAGGEVFDIDPNDLEIHLNDNCPKGFQLRPHIVWFGEEVPTIEQAQEIVKQADILIIIGTSLQVYPAAGLVNYAKPKIPIYLIDPQKISNAPENISIIQKGASEGMKILEEILLTQ